MSGGDQATQARSLRIALLLLMALLLGVLGLNAAHWHLDPIPPQSSHRVFQLVPRMLHLLAGLDSTKLPEQMDASGKAVALPSEESEEEQASRPGARPWWTELAWEGRLSPLYRPCPSFFWVCMPHSLTLAALLAHLLPGGAVAAGLAIALYFCLLLVSVFSIGRRLAGPWAGLTAACLAAGYPGLLGYSWWMEGFLPATAISVAIIAALLASDGFRRPWAVLLLGALCFTAWRTGEGLSEGIGVLMTVTIPTLLELAWGLGQARRGGTSPWRPLAGFLLLLALVAIGVDWAWATNGFLRIWQGLSDHDVAATAPEVASPLARWLVVHGAYILLIGTRYLRPINTALLLAALPFLLSGRVRRRGLLLAWFAVPALGYALMERKASWYGLPQVPPLAVMTALGLAAVPWARVRRGALGVAALLGALQLIIYSIPTRSMNHGVLAWLQEPPAHDPAELRDPRLVGPPNPLRGRLATISRVLGELPPERTVAGDPLDYIALLIPWDADSYGATGLRYAVVLSRPDLEVVNLASPTLLDTDDLAAFRPEDFTWLTCLREGQLEPCCDDLGAWLPPEAFLDYRPSLAAVHERTPPPEDDPNLQIPPPPGMGAFVGELCGRASLEPGLAAVYRLSRD